ncbi:hypothetical protein [Tenacibaculum jejuense]|uniref:Bacteriocin n=1 Tax=Tenacibaculum jejuense TaxID=584609 RepID=A0A238UB00_9FLAO|nr:hypothetical protein [Tenacibaculum jejuense]SNR16349.1 protein of unknown function [Tenacibaculum jejuense]
MRKSILNLGKALTKTEQKSLNGGGVIRYCNNVGGFCDPLHICESIPTRFGLGVCIGIGLE